MNKNAPSIGGMAAIVGFALSVVLLLTFLWIAFGGSLPTAPEGYRFKAAFPDAALLVEEADVRMAGVNVGKVKGKELAPERAADHRRDRDRRPLRPDQARRPRDAAPEEPAGRDLRGDRTG